MSSMLLGLPVAPYIVDLSFLICKALQVMDVAGADLRRYANASSGTSSSGRNRVPDRL